MAGLAAMGAQAPQNQDREMIDQVKQMLVQGATPEQLLGEGVPEELIMLAIEELQAEMAAQDQQAQAPVTPAGQGLAQQAVV